MGTLWAVGPGPWLPWEKAPTSPATRAPWTSEPARLLVPPGTGWHLTASAATPDPPRGRRRQSHRHWHLGWMCGHPTPHFSPSSLRRESGCWEPGSSRGRSGGSRVPGHGSPAASTGGCLHPSPEDRRPPNSQEGAGLCWVPSNLGGGERSRLIREPCQVGCEESR